MPSLLSWKRGSCRKGQPQRGRYACVCIGRNYLKSGHACIYMYIYIYFQTMLVCVSCDVVNLIAREKFKLCV